MSALRAVAAAAWLAALPGAGLADAFHVADLGAGGTGAECLSRAQATLGTYLTRHGRPAADVASGSWSASMFGVTGDRLNVNIACPYRDNISEVVLLTIHEVGEGEHWNALIDELIEIWDSDPAPARDPAPLTK